MKLILISGLSGSGKSVALNVLEDAGYYCIDNLPASLLLSTVDFLEREGVKQAAVAIDARSGESWRELPALMDTLLRENTDLRTLFLEAKEDCLIKRFSETRRRHPLSGESRSLAEAIQLEKELLAGVAAQAHRIDTSDMGPNALRNWVKEFISLGTGRLVLLFESFGFKHGIPLDADLVFDVRCLPNPHYDPALRPLTGKDEAVAAFLQKDSRVTAMLEDIRRFVENWLPCFALDNRAYLTVAIGCTGGQHRSVYFVEHLGNFFRDRQQVLLRHRGLHR
jgi:RNase adapter protein RapZ